MGFQTAFLLCVRYDLLHASNGVDNATLVVRAAEIGNTVLKVSSNSTFITYRSWIVNHEGDFKPYFMMNI